MFLLDILGLSANLTRTTCLCLAWFLDLEKGKGNTLFTSGQNINC
jgi:hypothetical protein